MQGKNLLTPHMGSIFNADEFLLQKWLWKKHTTLFCKNDVWFFFPILKVKWFLFQVSSRELAELVL